MIYVVAGYVRSGTTALMNAIEAGGIELAYERDPKRAQHHQREFTAEEVYRFGFPIAHENRCIKLLYAGLPPQLSPVVFALAPDYAPGYRVALLWRDPLEIRRSYEGWWLEAYGEQHALPWVTQDDGRLYSYTLGRMRAHLLNRRDVHSVTDIQYRSNYRADLPALLDEPEEVFGALVADGWPLDVAKAAATIDPTRCRYRAEALEAA